MRTLNTSLEILKFRFPEKNTTFEKISHYVLTLSGQFKKVLENFFKFCAF